MISRDWIKNRNSALLLIILDLMAAFLQLGTDILEFIVNTQTSPLAIFFIPMIILDILVLNVLFFADYYLFLKSPKGQN